GGNAGQQHRPEVLRSGPAGYGSEANGWVQLGKIVGDDVKLRAEARGAAIRHESQRRNVGRRRGQSLRVHMGGKGPASREGAAQMQESSSRNRSINHVHDLPYVR